ncbi:MAG: Gfo/Idh/MocA family oxidoreductase [Verrucomicrobia bacterium]|nr:Gfo/Idh/MocA family oxidoreductase [Verrucomicrobiota bacterium]
MNSSRSFTRRNFVKLAAFAGAAPFILPSRLWAAETKPAGRIALGFIGQGMQGRGLLKNFIPRDDVQVLAVCDVDTTRRESAQQIVETEYAKEMTAGTYKGCAAYNDFRELLARPDIDAVVIATPDHWHALIAIAAVNAGKDVYCEKPMAHTILEGRAMVQAVRAKKRILQVGSMQRSMSEFRAACELVRNGALGKVMKVEVGVGSPTVPVPCDLPEEPLEPGLDWDLWQGPAAARPYNSILSPRGVPKHWVMWRKYREYGGGWICDWGAHHFDIVQWAFGADTGGPVEFILPADKAATVGARFRYATGAEVVHVPSNGITFFGDQGKIYVNRGKFKLWLGDRLIAENPDGYTKLLQEHLPANAVRLYNSKNHLGDWLDSIRSRKPPICDVETGHRSATVCSLLNLAYIGGRPVKWNPAQEKFAGGTGDAKWLGGEFRAPWKLA